jgi:hypothetical protein
MVWGRFTTRYAMTQEWITDRLPTEADADIDGEVRIRRAPGSDVSRLTYWSYVQPDMDWQRSSFWQPPAGPDPVEPAEPDRIAALEQRVVRHLRAQDELIAAMAKRLEALEQRVAGLEAQMRPTAETFEQPELSYQRAKAEQLRSQAALLLAQANLVEAGQ